jgi:TolB-like protein/tetratricopeptide (TPR) repeat protein
MRLVPGSWLGPYEILAPIGAGGMGEVYRALDPRLGREVALKILPAEMAADRERLARFHREARAVAALNHPNIVTLYSVEESSGTHFLTMELVDGEPLNKCMPSEGFGGERAFEVARELAEAIAAAHDKGLVHRDLKPANIMITRDERVKVLDFGLAKDMRALGPKDETVTWFEQTQAGTIMGTPPYMSPEQISGSKVDHRTDIFSLGVILYEMITGQRPFQGASHMQLAAAILKDPTPAITKSGAPSVLVKLIGQCLEKKPDARIQTARLVVNALRSAQHAPANATPIAKYVDEGFWVALQPFKCTGASPELAALAEGLAEEIIAGFVRFSYLRVMNKGTEGAHYVLEGSLRQAGSQLRVSVQLMDKVSGANLWAENYMRPYTPETIFEIQDSLVPTIVSTVAETNGVLTHGMWSLLRDRDPLTLTPYEAMLRAFGYLEHLSFEEVQPSLSALKRAIEQEPNHAGCLAMISVLYADCHLFGWGLEPQALDLSLSYARRAVAAEPSHSAYYALAWAHWSRKEIPAFRNAADRSVALNPLDGNTIATLGLGTAYSGDWQRGVELMGRAMGLNPRHSGWYWYPLVHHAYREKDYARAFEYALRINLPGQFWSSLVSAMVHGQLGNRAEAAQAVKELLALKPDFQTNARQELEKWFAENAHVDHVLAGLRKAGLRTD